MYRQSQHLRWTHRKTVCSPATHHLRDKLVDTEPGQKHADVAEGLSIGNTSSIGAHTGTQLVVLQHITAQHSTAQHSTALESFALNSLASGCNNACAFRINVQACAGYAQHEQLY